MTKISQIQQVFSPKRVKLKKNSSNITQNDTISTKITLRKGVHPLSVSDNIPGYENGCLDRVCLGVICLRENNHRSEDDKNST